MTERHKQQLLDLLHLAALAAAVLVPVAVILLGFSR